MTQNRYHCLLKPESLKEVNSVHLIKTLKELKNTYELGTGLEILREQATHKLDVEKKKISLWLERWFLSSNAKDIGTLYLIFALLSGLVGTAFSVLIRLELSGPGVKYIADNQLYNSIITAHSIVMIFFMVKTSANLLKIFIFIKY